MLRTLLWIFLFGLAIVAWLIWAIARPSLFARRVQRALRDFERDRSSLESLFFEKAAASGKPRGLAWKSCAFQPGMLLARDRANGELVALVGVSIGFEAIPGGGMEEVEAVGNLRAATAVFQRNGNQWSTDGRAVFNLEPNEVLTRYSGQLDPIAT